MTEPRAGPAGSRRAVLVVEDDPLVRLVAVEFLLSEGYSVLQADTARAAIDSLMDHRVDLVFSDIQMPGRMDGNELAEWIRANFPNLPVLLTSGVEPDRGHGAGALLRKPYDLSTLSKRVAEALVRPALPGPGTFQ